MEKKKKEVAFRNKHFCAAEALEGIVMQLFLLEVRKRCFAPSIIWLHDGFGVLSAAEKHVRSVSVAILAQADWSRAGEASTSFSTMDDILRLMEGLRRDELVWLNTYLTERLRTLPPSAVPLPCLQAAQKHLWQA